MRKVLFYEVVSECSYVNNEPYSFDTRFYTKRSALKQFNAGVDYYSAMRPFSSGFGILSSVRLSLRKYFNETESELIMEKVFDISLSSPL